MLQNLYTAPVFEKFILLQALIVHFVIMPFNNNHFTYQHVHDAFRLIWTSASLPHDTIGSSCVQLGMVDLTQYNGCYFCTSSLRFFGHQLTWLTYPFNICLFRRTVTELQTYAICLSSAQFYNRWVNFFSKEKRKKNEEKCSPVTGMTKRLSDQLLNLWKKQLHATCPKLSRTLLKIVDGLTY